MSMISRRDFLKLTGLATTAVALTACDDETSGSSETPTTPTEEVTQKTNNEINASTTYTNGQTAKFGVNNHTAKLSCTVYEFKIDGTDEVFARVAETSFTIAAVASDEAQGENDASKEYNGMHGLDYSNATLEVWSDYTNKKTDLVEDESDDLSNIEHDNNDNSAVLTEDALDYIEYYVADLAEDMEKKTRTKVDDLDTAINESIDQGGVTYVSYVGLAYGGSPLAITASFDNPYYMANGSDIDYAFTATTETVTITAEKIAEMEEEEED